MRAPSSRGSRTNPEIRQLSPSASPMQQPVSIRQASRRQELPPPPALYRGARRPQRRRRYGSYCMMTSLPSYQTPETGRPLPSDPCFGSGRTASPCWYPTPPVPGPHPGRYPVTSTSADLYGVPMRCPACGLEADPTAGLCPHCRAPLHMPPGANLPGGAQLPHGAAPWGSHPGGIPAGGPQTWPASGYQSLEPGSGPGIRRHPWIWVVVVLALIFVGAGVTGVVLKVMHKVPHLPGVVASALPSKAGPDGRGQAMAIDALLNASSRSRGQLGPALDQVEKCGDLNAATATLQQVVTERDGQVHQGKDLVVNQLDQGEQLRTLLVQALTSSLQADQSFVAWAKNMGNGCTGKATHDADYTAAQTASAGATTNKQSFVKLWNPIATKYGLPIRSESSF